MDRDETNQSPTRQGELRESSRMDTFMNEHTLLDLLAGLFFFWAIVLALGVMLWLA